MIRIVYGLAFLAMIFGSIARAQTVNAAADPDIFSECNQCF